MFASSLTSGICVLAFNVNDDKTSLRVCVSGWTRELRQARRNTIDVASRSIGDSVYFLVRKQTIN